VRELRGLLNDLGTTPAVDPAVYAVNTTYLGRSAFEDHQPRQDEAA
jgi:sulfur carrier protein ThiS